MGNLAARSLTVIIISYMTTYDVHLKFTLLSEHAGIMMAANEGITEAIASFYWSDSDTVFLDPSYDLCPNIIPANFFWV